MNLTAHDFEYFGIMCPAMQSISGTSFGYPLVTVAEAYRYHSAIRIGWKRHAEWEIHHVIAGKVSYELDDGTSLELPGGTFLAIPPHVSHRSENGTSAPATRLAVRWRPKPPPDSAPPLAMSAADYRGIFAPLRADGPHPRVRAMSPGLIHAAKRLLTHILGLEDAPAGLPAARLRHTCNDLLLECALSVSGNEPIAAKGGDVISKTKRYIAEHCQERLQMKDLSRISGYGATQLYKLFRVHGGLSPNEFLIHTRIERAKGLLAAGNDPITAIAFACGFPSSSYFSTVFSKYTGVSPREFRCAAGPGAAERVIRGR